MKKHVLALSTALSILAVTPAFAQNATVDCTQEANKNDPACMNQQQNNTTQTQGGATTDQNAQTTTTTKSTTTRMSSGALIVPAERLNSAQVMSASDYIGKTVYDQAGNNIWAGARFPETAHCATDRIDGGRAWTGRTGWNWV